ncbi:MAG: hypothetical protein HFG26_12090 [Provencibacterium sp.]|jgi:dephospho-CoA kinase|nr:hypothetical protein [Provencibacterium sp.]
MKIGIESNLLRSLFRNVYFINGTAYAGKSTMVKLLSEKYDGICCGENYHEPLMDAVDEIRQPNLSYIRQLKDWQAFVSRTPQEYAAWIEGCSEEAADLELLMLIRHTASGRRVFVDTNLSPGLLREISDYRHVLFMLAPQEISVNRFFEREDREKQFIYQVLLQSADREKAFENYRECLRAVNSEAQIRAFAESGFYCIYREEARSVSDTLALVEKHFGLDLDR